MPTRPTRLRPMTSRQAKAEYKKRGPRISSQEQRQLDRAVVLQDRADKIKDAEKRRKANKQKKEAKDKREHDARQRLGIPSQKPYVSPNQMRLGVFFGKKGPEIEAAKVSESDSKAVSNDDDNEEDRICFAAVSEDGDVEIENCKEERGMIDDLACKDEEKEALIGTAAVASIIADDGANSEAEDEKDTTRLGGVAKTSTHLTGEMGRDAPANDPLQACAVEEKEPPQDEPLAAETDAYRALEGDADAKAAINDQSQRTQPWQPGTICSSPAKDPGATFKLMNPWETPSFDDALLSMLDPSSSPTEAASSPKTAKLPLLTNQVPLQNHDEAGRSPSPTDVAESPLRRKSDCALQQNSPSVPKDRTAAGELVGDRLDHFLASNTQSSREVSSSVRLSSKTSPEEHRVAHMKLPCVQKSKLATSALDFLGMPLSTQDLSFSTQDMHEINEKPPSTVSNDDRPFKKPALPLECLPVNTAGRKRPAAQIGPATSPGRAKAAKDSQIMPPPPSRPLPKPHPNTVRRPSAWPNKAHKPFQQPRFVHGSAQTKSRQQPAPTPHVAEDLNVFADAFELSTQDRREFLD